MNNQTETITNMTEQPATNMENTNAATTCENTNAENETKTEMINNNNN